MASDAVRGEWRPPATSRATAASLFMNSDGVVAVHDDANARLAISPYATLRVSDRVGQIPRRIVFPGGGVFETPDNDGVDRLIAPFRPRHAGFVHGLERFGPRMILLVALVVALSLALYRFAVPALVEVAVAVTLPIVPELMSQGVLASLDEGVFTPSGLSAERRDGLSSGFRQLTQLTARGQAGVTPTGHPAYTLNFRKGGFVGPNAFALPDGSIVVTDELVELAGDDDDLVLGVLAHEIGHVDHGHSLRQLYRAAGVTALVMLIGGDLGAGTEDILVQGTAVLALSYSRDAERDADRYSVRLMHDAGKDPAAIARFFAILSEKLGDKNDSDFFSSHPATPDRIEETKRYAEETSSAGS